MGGTMIQDPAAFVSTDFQRAVTTGLFASCAALVARGGVGIELAGDGGDPAAVSYTHLTLPTNREV